MKNRRAIIVTRENAEFQESFLDQVEALGLNAHDLRLITGKSESTVRKILNRTLYPGTESFLLLNAALNLSGDNKTLAFNSAISRIMTSAKKWAQTRIK